jgi:chromosome partitioning protein
MCCICRPGFAACWPGRSVNLQAVFVINRKIVNMAIGRDVTKALANFDLPVCERALNQRVVYAESAARGLAVVEAEPKSEAAREITRLARSLSNFNARKVAA